MIFQIILAAILIALLANLSQVYQFLRLCIIYYRLPGPNLFPIFGAAFKLAMVDETDMINIFQELSKGYRYIGMMIFGRPYAWLKDPAELERAMASTEHITKGLEYNTLMMWLKEGLLTSRGKKWHNRRKILTPTFHFKILEDCLPTMYDNAMKLVSKVLSYSNQPIDVDKFVTCCSLDIICEAAMGIKLNSQDNKSQEYVNDIKRASYLMIHKEKTFWLRNNIFFKYSSTGRELTEVISRLHAFSEKVISERQELLKGVDLSSFEGKKRMAFLDCLLYTERKHPGTFTSADIREEVDTFMFEGHDTTSAAVLFGLFLLGHHKDIQEKAFNELETIFGDSDRPATTKDLQEMKYLEMIIKETLRLYPSVPFMFRYFTTDLKLEDGNILPAGTDLIILPFLLHRDEEIYEDPEKFDPERFTDENCKKRHPFAYIPFSAGPRNCIGQKFAMMEMKVLISTILRNCLLESITKMETLKLKPLLILRPASTVEMIFTPRK